MKKIIFSFLLISSTSLLAQVGVGTNTPDNSAMLEVKSSSKGILFPRLTSAQRLAITSPASGLQVYDINTNSLWYFNGTYWVNSKSEANEGDIKSGIQTTDHAGWVLLDGRSLTSLSINQQAIAASLGLSGNLPNATNAYLVQNGGIMASVTGSNTVTLAQTNLPNVNFTGTTSSAGDHSHTIDPVATTTTSNGDHSHITDPAAVNTSIDGAHVHSLNMVDKDDGNFSNVAGQYPTGDSMKFNGADHFIDTETAGNHDHSVNIPATTSTTNGIHTHTVDIANTTSSTNGTHNHLVSVSSGGSATPINITPRSLTVNMFIYLGL